MHLFLSDLWYQTQGVIPCFQSWWLRDWLRAQRVPELWGPWSSLLPSHPMQWFGATASMGHGWLAGESSGELTVVGRGCSLEASLGLVAVPAALTGQALCGFPQQRVVLPVSALLEADWFRMKQLVSSWYGAVWCLWQTHICIFAALLTMFFLWSECTAH